MKKQVDTMFCDFCGASQHDRKSLIAAPNMAAICEECIALSLEIISKEHPQLITGILDGFAKGAKAAQAGQGA